MPPDTRGVKLTSDLPRDAQNLPSKSRNTLVLKALVVKYP
jgi:hypothetical protein